VLATRARVSCVVCRVSCVVCVCVVLVTKQLALCANADFELEYIEICQKNPSLTNLEFRNTSGTASWRIDCVC